MNTPHNKLINDQILSVIVQEKEAVETSDAEKYFSVLSEDTVFMPPNSLPKEGRMLREWLKDFVETFVVVWKKFESVEIEVVDNFAFHIYNYVWSVSPRNGGEAIKGRGKGMHILRKQKDGSWKIAREIWNNN